MRLRLEAARGQLDQVLQTNLASRPGTFFPTNRYGRLNETIEESVYLLTEVKDSSIARFSYSSNVKTELLGLQNLVDSILLEAS